MNCYSFQGTQATLVARRFEITHVFGYLITAPKQIALDLPVLGACHPFPYCPGRPSDRY